jgi:REP element-mobilizing transposase RayT
MPYDPRIHHRRSIRLHGYDYSQEGAYFVTICVQGKALLFGEVHGETMHPNEAGRMVQSVWDGLPEHYPGVDIDAFQLMPNHVHGIIVLYAEDAKPEAPRKAQGRARGPAPTPRDGAQAPGVGAGPRACPTARHGAPRGPGETGQETEPDRAWGRDPTERLGKARDGACAMSLPDVVARFKSLTTTRYSDRVLRCGWPRFQGRVWQRNYYEHVVRDEDELYRIRQYIMDNPASWAYDRENPEGKGPHDGEPWQV